MKTALVWFSGLLFGLGLVCLMLWATNTSCEFNEYVLCWRAEQQGAVQDSKSMVGGFDSHRTHEEVY